VTGSKSYVVRHAGSPSRLGKVWKTYPYTLRALLGAIEDARLQSYNNGPHVLAVVNDRKTRIIRRFELGREVPVTLGASTRA
jgi:hypothetical protein